MNGVSVCATPSCDDRSAHSSGEEILIFIDNQKMKCYTEKVIKQYLHTKKGGEKMKKKVLAMLLALTFVFTLVLTACGNQAKPDEQKPDEQKQGEGDTTPSGEGAPFHIGIVTGTVSQSEDDERGAEAMVAKYGNAKDGGYITHLNYPDNFSQEMETTIQQITSLADDPLMKVIVVNQAVPGTTAAFEKIRAEHPDIILLAGSSQEDTAMIEGAADIVVDPDNSGRGYLIPLAAQKLGCKTFVHVSFPRHMGIELLSLRKDIMEATCDKLGIKFAMETAPDPTTDVGVTGAQQFILEKMPAWVEKYGKDTAFFATNDAHTEPILKKCAELGAYFIEADLPSPIMGYPAAFGVELKDVAGDWPKILERVEQAVEKAGEDLYVQIPISMTQAALGLDINVRNLKGETIKVSIPSGIQNGKIIRVKGQGLPRYRNADLKGDLYIKVQIDTPKRLGLKAKQIMKELSDAIGENDNPTPVAFEND